LFNLGLNREVELVRRRVLDLADYWDTVAFLEPGEAPGLGAVDLRCSGWRRLWTELRASGRQIEHMRKLLARCLGEPSVRSRGLDVRICFNHLHQPVLYALGLLSRAERLYFPHGLDQPRRRQLIEHAYLFAKRGPATAVATWSRQRDFRRSLYALRPWLWLRQGIQIPFPFDGVDQALSYTVQINTVPCARISGPSACLTLAEIADRWGVRAALEPLMSEFPLASTCLVLLPEIDAQHSNSKLLASIDALMEAVQRRMPMGNFVLKPHPRSRYADFEKVVMGLQAFGSGRQIRAWPKASMTVQTELVAAVYPFGCVASLGSCAMPRWTAAGTPHLVSRRAAALFDSGWPHDGLAGTLYPRYVQAIGDLQEEGTVLAAD